jgi:hypothetical protein
VALKTWDQLLSDTMSNLKPGCSVAVNYRKFQPGSGPDRHLALFDLYFTNKVSGKQTVMHHGLEVQNVPTGVHEPHLFSAWKSTISTFTHHIQVLSNQTDTHLYHVVLGA